MTRSRKAIVSILRKALVVVFLPLLLCWQTAHASDEKISVAFINPDQKGNPFWDAVSAFMAAVSEDLNIDLDIHYAQGNRLKNVAIAEALSTRDNPPQYMVYPYLLDAGKRILQIAEENGVKSMIFNTAIHPKNRAIIGDPRQNFKHWIGHLEPDDNQAGALLGRYLLERAHAKATEKAPIEVIALSGGHDSSPAQSRNEGLLTSLRADKTATLSQLVHAHWEPEVAARQTRVLTSRYPNSQVIWSASDAMAIAAAETLDKPEEFTIGGIDWTMEGLLAVQSGLLDATVGGHFMEGGWALIMIYDYHHDKDFAESGLHFKTPMHLIHKDNVDPYADRIIAGMYDRVDFKQLTRTHNTGQSDYSFDYKQIFRPQDPN